MKFDYKRAVVLLSLAFPAVLRAATIHGNVLDPTGAPLNAYVFIFDNSSHPKINGPLPGVTTIADNEGRFSVELAPGFYDVCTFASGFAPLCRKVRLKTSDDSLSENFRMKVDPSSTGKEFQ